MKKMKIAVVVFWIMLLCLPKKHWAQKMLEYKITQSIAEDLVCTIDSAFDFKRVRESNANFRGIRMIDTKGKISSTKSWTYLTDKTKFVVLNSFPYDLNTKNYEDLIVLEVKEHGSVILLQVIIILNKYCDQIPVHISSTYIVKSKHVVKVSNTIRVLDNWSPYGDNE